MHKALRENWVLLPLEIPKNDFFRWTGGYLFAPGLKTDVVGHTAIEVLR